MSRYHLRTLGGLSLYEEDGDGAVVLSDAKSLAVLAYLADTPGQSADRSHLARLLWPEKEASKARAGLRQALYYLRQKIADGITLLRSEQDRVALDQGVLQVDLWAFEEALSRGDWDRVLALYDGPFLGGYDVEGAEEFRHWRNSREDGIRAGLREACRALISTGLDEDDPEQAVRGARRWVELNPLDESAQEALIRSLVAAGDRAGAFRAYESYRTLLREELGDSPGPRLSGTLEELRSLAEELPAGEASAAGEAAGGKASGAWEPELARSAGAAEDGSRGIGGSKPSGLRRGLAAAVLALAVLLIAAAGWRVLAGAGESIEERTSARVEVLVRAGGSKATPSYRRIRWFGDSARVDPAPGYPRRGVPAPDGRRRAVSLRTAGGTDLALEGREGDGDSRILVATEADELPLAWSPDGERILYESGRMEADGRYVRRYRIHRLDGEEEVALGLTMARPGPSRPHGDWSPLGTSVAVVSDSAGNPDVWAVNPDGTAPRNLTAGHGGRDDEPAFSPDGSRIAFVSDRSGNRDVWVVDVDGERARRLTWSPRPEEGPVWLDPRRIGYFRTAEDGRAWFRSVDLSTGEDRRLVEVPSPRGGVVVRRPGTSGSWIASVELPDHLTRAAPGQWIRRSAAVRDADGAELPEGTAPLRWSVSDTSVVSPAAGGGWLRVRGTGAATVRVSAAGWRGDSVRLRSRRLEVRELASVLGEDWTGGIDSTRWMPVGEPRPTVVRPSGRFPAAFLNGGDENYHSGAVSRTALGAEAGLTVEFWGRSPLTELHYQGLWAGLVPQVPTGEVATWGATDAVLEVGSGAALPDSLSVHLHDGIWHVPAPESLAAWRRYTVQVDTAGRVSVLVDGRLHWRSPETVDLELLDGTHLALYGRSKGTRILHGPVRVWEGVRYRIP